MCVSTHTNVSQIAFKDSKCLKYFIVCSSLSQDEDLPEYYIRVTLFQQEDLPMWKHAYVTLFPAVWERHLLVSGSVKK